MGETVTAWLVEREFYDENLVSAVYATRDGERYLKRQRSGDEAEWTRTVLISGELSHPSSGRAFADDKLASESGSANFPASVQEGQDLEERGRRQRERLLSDPDVAEVTSSSARA